MTALEKDVLAILSDDARISHKKIAAMLSKDEAEISACIAGMEKSGLLVKYTAIVNSEKADDALVEALIEVKVAPKKKEGFDGMAKQIAAFPEVKAVYLMSGAYDLLVLVEARTLKELAFFVSEKLSTLEMVTGTATSFVLKRYKEAGVIFEDSKSDQRLVIQA